MSAASVYYNEIDPFAAQWLRELMADGLIPQGYVDERSIVDVQPGDLAEFSQCHFFAGIGGWAYALELADWGDRPVWTGSCPCQPLSSAGKRKGHADERHLWPAFYRLIAECQPTTVFGEQVASKDGREWLAGIRADLEALGYAIGAADLCAAGVGAPHIRQRLYWVANANGRFSRDGRIQCSGQHGFQPEDGCDHEGMGDADCPRQQTRDFVAIGKEPVSTQLTVTGAISERMGNAESAGSQEQRRLYRPSGERHSGLIGFAIEAAVPRWNGPTVAVECSDGYRRASAQPDAFPLAHGVPNRMGTLRGAGNAIVPQTAAQFIPAFIEAEYELAA